MGDKICAPPPDQGGGRGVVVSLAANFTEDRANLARRKALLCDADRAEHRALVCQGVALALRDGRRFEAQAMADRQRVRAQELRRHAEGGVR